MAKIPNPRWAYPDVDGTSGGILIDAPVAPIVAKAAAPPAAKSKGKTK